MSRLVSLIETHGVDAAQSSELNLPARGALV